MDVLNPVVCPKCGGERPFIYECAVCGGAGVLWPPYPSDYEDGGAVRFKIAKRCPRCLSILGAFPHFCWRIK